MPAEQTLLIVVHTTLLGRPAPMAACRAGACPRLALRTFPNKTSCTALDSNPALSNASAPHNIKINYSCTNLQRGLKWMPPSLFCNIFRTTNALRVTNISCQCKVSWINRLAFRCNSFWGFQYEMRYYQMGRLKRSKKQSPIGREEMPLAC